MKTTITVRAKLMTAKDDDGYSNISDQSNNNDTYIKANDLLYR